MSIYRCINMDMYIFIVIYKGFLRRKKENRKEYIEILDNFGKC